MLADIGYREITFDTEVFDCWEYEKEDRVECDYILNSLVDILKEIDVDKVCLMFTFSVQAYFKTNKRNSPRVVRA